jgi:hypothetical protein
MWVWSCECDHVSVIMWPCDHVTMWVSGWVSEWPGRASHPVHWWPRRSASRLPRLRLLRLLPPPPLWRHCPSPASLPPAPSSRDSGLVSYLVFTYSLTRLLAYSLIRLFAYSNALLHTLTHSLTHSLNAVARTLIHLPNNEDKLLTHSLTHMAHSQENDYKQALIYQ